MVIIGAGMGGLTTGIALRNLVTKFAFLSKLKNSSCRRCNFAVVEWCEMSELSGIN